MRGKRILKTPVIVAILVILMSILAVSAAQFSSYLPFITVSKVATAQDRPVSSMEQRLDQVIAVLQQAPTCGAAAAAIDDGMEILYGGLRPLPSKDSEEQTTRADQLIAENEMKFAEALGRYATQTPRAQERTCDEERRRALDLKLFIEEMNEVARAVGEITLRCGDGDTVEEPPCDELKPLLDEENGEVTTPGSDRVQAQQPGIIRPSYSVKLRSPFIPRWFGGWEEDIRITEPIGNGECAVIFKETRGLMLRVHFQRITVVTDPWVNVFGLPRGTQIPIWTLEWIPSEYVKEWNICNRDGTIQKTVTQRVKQDVPLTFFWRYYHKDP